jgi:hypothetical protein
MIFCYSSAGRQRRPYRSRIRVGSGGSFESRVRSMRLPFKHVPSLGARIVFRPFRAIPRRTAVTSGLTRCYRISNPSIQVTNTLNTSYVRAYMFLPQREVVYQAGHLSCQHNDFTRCCYSFRKEFTGFASADCTDLRLTVAIAIRRTIPPATGRISIPSVTR